VSVRLTELHPHWTGADGPGIFNADMTPSTPRHGIGITFDCPLGHPADCAYDEVGGDGTHERHFVSFRNPIDGGPPFEASRPLWNRIGDTFETLQLSPSIFSDPAKGGCGWHGYIALTNPGEIT
jgi:hypothetical protein